MIPLGKQIQTSLRLISVSLSNVLYCIYDVSVVSRCTLYLNKILFTLTGVLLSREPGLYRGNVGTVRTQFIFYEMCPGASRYTGCPASG